MRAMRAEGFRGYGDLKLVNIPKPHVPEGRVLVKIAAAGVLNEVRVGEQTMQMLATATPVQLRALQTLQVSASV